MAAKSDVQRDLRVLTILIGAAAQGWLSLDQISRESNMSMTRRTLIRRLNGLVESGDIRKTGVGRGAKYFGISHAAPEPTLPKQTELYMPLSKASSAIIKQVTDPLGSRKPVGYDRAFLDGCRPNQTGYLTTVEKARLADLGITSMPVCRCRDLRPAHSPTPAD